MRRFFAIFTLSCALSSCSLPFECAVPASGSQEGATPAIAGDSGVVTPPGNPSEF